MRKCAYPDRCPSTEHLQAMLDEQLDAAPEAELLRMVETCSGCQDRLQELVGGLSDVLGHSETDPIASVDQPGQAATGDWRRENIADPMTPKPAAADLDVTGDLSPVQAMPANPDSDATGDHSPAQVTPAVADLDVTGDHSPAQATPVDADVDVTRDHSPAQATPTADAALEEDIAHALPALAEAGYDVLQEIGHGGMGIVFKAHQRDLNRLVAIKMILTGEHIPASARARFQTEAEAVAQLRHPGIIQIYDYGQANGMPYFALELADGGSLKERLEGSPQPPRESARTLVQLAQAVQGAHDVGIIHRDLKPGNVLLGTKGELKIGDFGLAKRLEAEDGHTISGQIVGSPAYMAPEQARGDNDQVGPLADVYALGVILYEMLTGRCPFRGTSPISTIKLVLDADLVPPRRLQPGVPRDLETICLKALSRETDRRYASAAELADDLERYLEGSPILARRTPVWERAYKWARKRPTTVAWATVSMIAIVALIGTGGWYWRQQNLSFTSAREDSRQLLSAGERKIDRGQWNDAKVDLSNALQLVANRPALTELHDKIQVNLERVADEEERATQVARRAREAAAARTRYETFLNLRNDALFHATQYTDLKLPSVRETALATSRDALALYAAVSATGDEGREIAQGFQIVDPLPNSHSEDDRATIRSACYELLVIRADTLADGGNHTESGGNPSMALSALNSAERLRARPSLAIRRRRIDYLHRLGQSDQAADERDLAADQEPDDSLDYFLVGLDSKRHAELRDALLHFTGTLRRDPDHFWAQYLSAVCHLSLGEYQEAITALYPCIAQRPEFASLYIKRGIASQSLAAAAVQQKQPKTAQPLWEQASEDYHRAFELLANENVDDEARTRVLYELLVNRGVLTLKRSATPSDLKNAMADFQEAKKLMPTPYNPYVNLAQIYRASRQWDRAVEEIDQALRNHPQVAALYRERALLRLALSSASSNSSALNSAALGDLAEAVKYEENPALLAGDHVQRARMFYLADQFENTVHECDLALSADSDQLNAQLWRARALLELEKYDQLLAAVQDYLKGGGKPHVDLYEVSGLALARQHQYQSAIDAYTLGIQLEATPALHTHRGMAYLAERAYGLALDDFDQAVNVFPQGTPDDARTSALQANAHIGRGLARVVLKNEYRQAAEDADRALALNGGDYTTIYKAAVVHALAGEAAITWELRRRGRATVGLAYRNKALTLLAQAFERLPANIPPQQFWQETVVNDQALNGLRTTSGFRVLQQTVTRNRR